MLQRVNAILLVTALIWGPASAYSALHGSVLVANPNYAEIARTLVHQADWAAVGTISTNNSTLGYPMVNVISTDDSDASGASTGKIHFMLMDRDFTGQDWRQSNKVTFMYTDAQHRDCLKNGGDPMDHSCPRVMLSGKVIKMDPQSASYCDALEAFKKRHPAAEEWDKAHVFYLCEFEIQNIFVFASRLRNVSPEEYYNTPPK